MAKQTPETLAADLKRLGGPKKPTNEQRAAAARRAQANPGKPLLYNDKEMIDRGARPAGPARPQLNAPPARPITFPSGPGSQPPMGPRLNPSSPPAYQPLPYRPMTPTTAPGGLPGRALPQQSDWHPPQPMGMDTGAWRPPMNNAPPAPASDNESLSTFFFSLGRMLGQARHGTQPEPQQPPKPWLPDLWSLSGR